MELETLDYASDSGRRIEDRAWPMRLWLSAPDWLFRLLGAGFFFAFVGLQAPDYYYKGLSQLGPFYSFPDGSVVRMPLVRILIDATYLLIALGFCFRIPARSRADRGHEIMIALVGAFWPFLPFAIDGLLKTLRLDWAQPYELFMWKRQLSFATFASGTALVLVGNALDVWGYGKLFRSISIVPEARDLKVSGPYRFVRHPIYLGQMLAQAGVWLFFAQTHVVWIAFYACFVGMQLYRSRLEDRVLERAFGEPYLAWKRRTFWFV